MDSTKDDYLEYFKKIKSTLIEHAKPSARQQRFVKFEERLERSDTTKEDIIKHAPGKYLMQWRGLVLLKSPIDFSIYQLMLQEIKPPTIIELGTFNGGGAAWMADLMKIHDVQSHVYSMDIDFTYLEPTLKDRKDITFIKGDSNKVEEAFPEDMLKTLPHPWIIIEDSHINVQGLFTYFHKFTKPGDYLVLEDSHPLIQTRMGFGLLESVGEYEPVGTGWVYDPFKEFMKIHGSHYRVDTGYTDLYGYNGWNYNSIICRV